MPLYVMNVTYPIVDREVIDFCRGKKAVLMVEEGQPEFIEQVLHKILRNADIPAKMHGKDLFPMAGEYTAQVMSERSALSSDAGAPMRCRIPHALRTSTASRSMTRSARLPTSCHRGHRVLHRLSGAGDFRDEAGGEELGPHHIAADIGCHLFSILPPFNIGATTMGYDLRPVPPPRSMSRRESARSH